MAPLLNAVRLALVTVLVAQLGLNPSSAQAAQPLILPTPPDLLNVVQLNDRTSLYYSTGAQRASLQTLQQQAIRNTLADHGLQSGDAPAVQSWARDDAEAELYGLLVQAANTAACSPTQTPGNGCRSTDQQNAVNWLAGMAQREGVLAARNAGLEYVKWAGLSQATYSQYVDTYVQHLSAGIDTSTDRANLETFLGRGFTSPASYAIPTPGTTWTASTPLQTIQRTATAGYCVYRSPAPYQTDFTGNIFAGTNATAPPTCQLPGGGIGGLADANPGAPAYDDFVKWGQSVTTYTTINTTSYTQTAHDIALAVGLGGIVGSVATGAAIGAALPGVMAGTAFVATVFPSAGFVTGVSTATFSTLATAAGTTDAVAAAASAGAVGAAGVAAIVAGIILFITGTTIETIQIVQQSQLPQKLATLIEDAPNQAYDPTSMLADSSGGAGTLYSLFVNATMPSPLANCVIYTPVDNPVCLDPPQPPAPDLQNDPEFLVSKSGGPPSAQPTITWYAKGSQVTTTARVHETWFIEQLKDNAGRPLRVMYSNATTGQEIQTLRIQYTDWSGNEQTALLVNVPTVGYRFVSLTQQPSGTVLNPGTCVASGTCAYSDSITYVDRAGSKYSAKLSQPTSPVVTAATWTPQNPVEGQPVTFQTDVSSNITTWTIEDKPVSQLILAACYDSNNKQVPCATPTVTLTGNPVTYAFPTSGSFGVGLTVSDSAGRSATSSVFTVQVADAPPQLAVYPTCNPDPLLICLIRSPNVLEVPPGTATSLGGELIHAGREDVESLAINWGDNTPDNTVSNKASPDPSLIFDFSGQSTSSGDIHLPFQATHTYANPGAYTVTLTATDQSGATTTANVTESVLAVASATSTATATSSPTASLTPTPGSTSTPTATAPSTPSPTAATSASSTSDQTVEATATPTPNPTAATTATSTSDQSVGATASPTVNSTATLVATPTPTSTPTPTALSASATASVATSASAPAPTATRTSTPSSSGGGGSRVGGAGAGATGGAGPQPAQPQPATNAGMPADVPPVEVGGVTVTGPQPATQTQPDMTDAPVASSVTSAPAYAALSIGLIGVDGLAPGQQALLTVLVVNPSSVDALPTLVVQDVLPAGLTFSHAVTEDWACASDDGLVVMCTSISTLGSGGVTQLQLAADVADDAAGTLTNVASVSSASLDPTLPSPTSIDTLEIPGSTESPPGSSN